MRTHPCPKPALHAWLHLMKVYYVAARCMEQELKEKGMTLPRFEIISQLGVEESGCTQDSLCDKLLVTKGNISGLLDRMVKVGWVQRDADPCNRRCNRVQLTPRGRKIYRSVMPKRESCLSKMFSRLNRKEQDQLNNLLEKLLESVKYHTGGG